jgi:hypothetical protein
VRSRRVSRTDLLRSDSALAKTELLDDEVANRGRFVIRIATLIGALGGGWSDSQLHDPLRKRTHSELE